MHLASRTMSPEPLRPLSHQIRHWVATWASTDKLYHVMTTGHLIRNEVFWNSTVYSSCGTTLLTKQTTRLKKFCRNLLKKKIMRSWMQWKFPQIVCKCWTRLGRKSSSSEQKLFIWVALRGRRRRAQMPALARGGQTAVQAMVTGQAARVAGATAEILRMLLSFLFIVFVFFFLI